MSTLTLLFITYCIIGFLFYLVSDREVQGALDKVEERMKANNSSETLFKVEDLRRAVTLCYVLWPFIVLFNVGSFFLSLTNSNSSNEKNNEK